MLIGLLLIGLAPSSQAFKLQNTLDEEVRYAVRIKAWGSGVATNISPKKTKEIDEWDDYLKETREDMKKKGVNTLNLTITAWIEAPYRELADERVIFYLNVGTTDQEIDQFDSGTTIRIIEGAKPFPPKPIIKHPLRGVNG